ncbi:hypothetical protein [Mucilaginibacter sp. L3T2-6]|uniref:hypothetical protein n=1 Tax=Mucilaginibacter sp. L3T2-6 TaxID=3062491 RepID=UPI002676189C|nr:hypothetical protein [Mucilaginibacter sp. L3T2-6]MDO3642677.1 hypothetical protein [Mucilaginibacter sp. L3T2-6]MDV6215326.1 hypothetical protein [Mucilaginibacter sp. L3T2-6]
MMNILITAATSAEAHKLKNQFAHDNVILGDYTELPGFMKIIKLPSPASMSYAHEMLTLCLDEGIKRLYALKEDEWRLLNEAKQLFAEYGIELVHRP